MNDTTVRKYTYMYVFIFFYSNNHSFEYFQRKTSILGDGIIEFNS